MSAGHPLRLGVSRPQRCLAAHDSGGSTALGGSPMRCAQPEELPPRIQGGPTRLPAAAAEAPQVPSTWPPTHSVGSRLRTRAPLGARPRGPQGPARFRALESKSRPPRRAHVVQGLRAQPSRLRVRSYEEIVSPGDGKSAPRAGAGGRSRCRGAWAPGWGHFGGISCDHGTRTVRVVLGSPHSGRFGRARRVREAS